MTRKIKLLDLFCGAGGASMGYHQAGFEVTGIDINPQPNYPLTFVQADAIEFLKEHGHEYHVIHASPPCQRFSAMQNIHKNKHKHPDLLTPTREILEGMVCQDNTLAYVIENVVGAPMRADIMLCGTWLGLPLAKHRLFDSNVPMPILTPTCNHQDIYDPYHGGEQARGEREKLSKASGIDWFMTRKEVREAIPPAYTKFIGQIVMEWIYETETIANAQV